MELLRRFKFWIGLGLLVLASGVVLGVWFLPMRDENSQLATEWEQTATTVRTLADGEVAPRGQAAKYEEAAQEVAEKREMLAQAHSGAAVDLSAPIPDPDTGAQDAGIEPGIWKFIYEKAMRALERDIRRSFVKVEDDELVKMREFPGTWPTEEEVRQETRSYWIQRSLLKAVASINTDRMTAPNLNEFDLAAEPERLLSSSDGTAYRPQGFTVELEAEFSMVPFIIDRLMACDIPVNITSVDINRSDDVLRRAAQRRVVQQKELVEADVVGGRRAARGGYGAPPGVGPGAAAEGAAAAAAAQAAAMGAQMAAMMGPGRRPAGGPPRRRTRRPGRARAEQDELEPAVEARHIPTALVEVTIKGYANVPRPQKEAEAEPESE